MELRHALRTTGAVRAYRPEPVADEVLARVLDTARFAPSGGNQQGWHVVVVQDPNTRLALRDLYLPGWYDYLTLTAAGLRPWAPTNDPVAEAAALAAPGAAGVGPRISAATGGFAERLHEVPVLLVVFVDLRVLAAVDRDTRGYPLAGGASVYPFCWGLLLAGREEGLGGVITTMLLRDEPAVKALLDSPDHWGLAAVVAMGHPVRQPRSLKRAPVGSFATVDRATGRAFGPTNPPSSGATAAPGG